MYLLCLDTWNINREPTLYPSKTFWYLLGSRCWTTIRFTSAQKKSCPLDLQHEMSFCTLPGNWGFLAWSLSRGQIGDRDWIGGPLVCGDIVSCRLVPKSICPIWRMILALSLTCAHISMPFLSQAAFYEKLSMLFDGRFIIRNENSDSQVFVTSQVCGNFCRHQQ